MGSVACAAKNSGFDVFGSDTAVYEPMRSMLASAGIHWFDGYDEENILNARPDVIIVGNAISRGNPELEFVLDNRLPMTSMAEFVGSTFIGRSLSVVVAGTHGKTSTSTMVAWMLETAGCTPNFLIGGAPRCFDVSCRYRPNTLSDNESIFVIEGDEYDTAFFDKRSKFVHYRPWHLLINNVEFDHADIFPNLDAVLNSFISVVRLVPRKGMVFINADDQHAREVIQRTNPLAPVQTVGESEQATWRILDINRTPDYSEWTLVYDGSTYGRFRTRESGLHSIRNASIAIASTFHLGGNAHTQQQALDSLILPKRRLEVLGMWHGRIVIDDFAHHPTAIKVTLDAVRQRYPSSRICAVFEPRSNTSTRSIFQKEFEQCFRSANAVVIGPVNRPERYAEHDRLNVPSIVEAYSQQSIPTFAVPQPSDKGASWGFQALPFLDSATAASDVILLLSNGNVGGLRELLVPGLFTAE